VTLQVTIVPKTEDIKPQISQISQMTETKEFGVIRCKNASGTKMSLVETVFSSPLICEICGICGFKF
jgi:hypothetical protein